MSTRINQRQTYGAASTSERQPQQANGRTTPNLTGTGISFTNPATIADSGNGLAIFAPGDRIEVTGPSNRGRWTVATAAAGSLTVTPGRIATASAGGSVSIRKVG